MSVSELATDLHRYSVEEYEQLVELGAFEDQRVELIDGLLVDMSPRSPQHENAVAWLSKWLARRINPDRYELRVCGSVRLDTSEPGPDLMVVDAVPRRRTHPMRAHLVIEVALSPRERDLTVKPALYAPAVADYWVVDLQAEVVVVHRDPVRRDFRTITVHGRSEQLAPANLAIEPLAVASLFDAI